MSSFKVGFIGIGNMGIFIVLCHSGIDVDLIFTSGLQSDKTA
jgi:hypothetical protein